MKYPGPGTYELKGTLKLKQPQKTKKNSFFQGILSTPLLTYLYDIILLTPNPRNFKIEIVE